MSKKFKSQASSARAASTAFGSSSFGFGTPTNAFQTAPSTLSYITEFPDLSTISDPNLVVSLRNLGKKDSTTKAKAIEEIQEHVAKAPVIEPGFLDAWVALYPRATIDNSRRVRQNAHFLQGSLTVASGKRIAPQLPKVIGPWLSGTYDSDRAVARAAQDSIAASFNSEDKRRQLWKVYHEALVQYAEDAILTQTPKTLSDERSTTPDDAETKFVRAVGNAMLMLNQTIKFNAPAASTTPIASDRLQSILKSKKLWEYAYNQDAFLRKALYTLTDTAVSLLSGSLDWPVLSSSLIGKALHTSQIGSSSQLAETLVTVTAARPEIWTTDYNSKTSASKRLLQFLRNGSQHGSATFWTTTGQLLRKIPVEVWNTGGPDNRVQLVNAAALLDATKTGLTNSDEPRHNLESAWSMYGQTAFWLVDELEEPSSKEDLLTSAVLPIIAAYASADPRYASWSVPSSFAQRLCASILLHLLERNLDLLFEKTWLDLAQSLIETMRLSLPESSKDFRKSQDGVIAHSERFFRLKRAILQSDRLDQEQRAKGAKIFETAEHDIVLSAIELLTARNGKPYAAAAVLGAITAESQSTDDDGLTHFLDSTASAMLSTPSAEYLVAAQMNLKRPMETTIDVLIVPPLTSSKAKALAQILTQSSTSDLVHFGRLTDFVYESTKHVNEQPVQLILKAVLLNPKVVNSEIANRTIAGLLQTLSPETDSSLQNATLQFLSTLPSTSASAHPVLNGVDSNSLLTRLLVLSDNDSHEVSELASNLVSKLQLAPTTVNGVTSSSSHGVIVDQLSGIGTPLSIFALIDLAKKAISQADLENTNSTFLPTIDQWSTALGPHLSSARSHTLSITSPLQGLVALTESSTHISNLSLQRDSDDFSLLFRLVLYVTRILSETELFDKLSVDERSVLYFNLPLALQLVNEKLTLESANDIWLTTTPEVSDEAADVLAQAILQVQNWLQDEALLQIWSDRIRSISNLTVRDYFYALTFTDIASRFVDSQGPGLILSSFETEITQAYRSQEVARSVSLLAVNHDYLVGGQSGRRLLNELVAACTELKVPQHKAEAFRPLLLLNILLNGHAEVIDSVPSQRIVFLMQNLVRLLADESTPDIFRAEVLRLLDPVLSSTKDIYGDHWEQVLDFIDSTWQLQIDSDHSLPILHASLRLYGRIKSLAASEEPNEDLVEVLNSKESSLEHGLVKCLESFTSSHDEINQPRKITAGLLRRQLQHITIKHDPKLYLLLSSTEEDIQGAAHDLLHRSIPQEQEQISLDIVLEHKDVQLPPDLISLLSEAVLYSNQTSQRKTYLLSWQLVFDHFTKASYKLREVYAENVKSQSILPSLLDLICELCLITSGRAIDPSKFDITQFQLGTSDSSRKEEQWLAAHLYYCALLYLPGATRSWFIEQKNRVKSPLESWTQRYFTPTLVATAISTVTQWVSNQAQDESEAPIVVKSSPHGSEAVASIAIDPESPPISLAVSLPSSYPLETPIVSSRTRVGVSEKNWQSWLRTFQIIIFSTGSIIEGLVAFRRNVQGALKGQSECAICYSIIGTDMQTPNKKCGTCRNTFHSVCLFRWFKSSNSSSCPLCRNNFNYA